MINITKVVLYDRGVSMCKRYAIAVYAVVCNHQRMAARIFDTIEEAANYAAENFKDRSYEVVEIRELIDD
jgi:hypothetical protein